MAKDTDPDCPASRRRRAAHTQAKSPGVPAYSRIRIGYRDADGEETERVITVGAIITDDDRPARLVAYCHLRGAVRSFRADRFLGFFDPDTGAALRTVSFVEDPAEFRRLAFTPPPREASAPFASIAEAHAHYAETLSGSGWVVETRSEAWAEYVELHRHFLRGAGILKEASVSLGYAPIWEDVIDTPKGSETVPGRSRDRPWTVTVVRRGKTSFATATAAAEAFEASAADDAVKRT